MSFFEKVRGNFGFGCMRLPMNGDDVDTAQFSEMVDKFMASGFNYFDTAHGYLSGKSETAIAECLVKRYPRESFTLTNKLTNLFFKSETDVKPFFEQQLAWCGVDYFDFYLMHSQSKDKFEYFKRCRAYEQALELKAEGKIKHFGISFHDTADVLEEILTEYPQIELVQIQLNYVDWNSSAVQSRLCVEVCKKFGKPIVVMEPVKGGHLANLPDDAARVFDELDGGSAASYALRFAAGCDNVFMVLSGMSDISQAEDNLSTMSNFTPLNQVENDAVNKVVKILASKHLIACTACRYCVDGCPKHISIPDLFACMNAKQLYKDWNADVYYHEVHTKNKGKASDCIRCGKCEKICPQHLPIRQLLQGVAKQFDVKGEDGE